MTATNQSLFVKDLPNKKITVTRTFNASVGLVWKAWTEKESLDEWWAPRPWKAKTKEMSFVKGGHWLYAMRGPNNECHWSKAEYIGIEPQKRFHGKDFFCDEEGKPIAGMPVTEWKVSFIEQGDQTTVMAELLFESIEQLQELVKMGFEQGFTMAHENLDQYLEIQFKLRQQLKTNNMARVTTYLNFPGNTEEAMNFYRSVFKTEFNGNGIQRFGDIPPQPGYPPIAENVKKMVLHVELPIKGDHLIMATDAPKEMGMTVSYGNNMHICIDTESRAETKRLFDELSKEGKVTMPLADMFWGAYFASFTDKFGINWMLNCQTKE
ncbi:MAG: SRPBCC domain-containing protein [Chitinophagales bacterium]